MVLETIVHSAASKAARQGKRDPPWLLLPSLLRNEAFLSVSLLPILMRAFPPSTSHAILVARYRGGGYIVYCTLRLICPLRTSQSSKTIPLFGNQLFVFAIHHRVPWLVAETTRSTSHAGSLRQSLCPLRGSFEARYQPNNRTIRQ